MTPRQRAGALAFAPSMGSRCGGQRHRSPRARQRDATTLPHTRYAARRRQRTGAVLAPTVESRWIRSAQRTRQAQLATRFTIQSVHNHRTSTRRRFTASPAKLMHLSTLVSQSNVNDPAWATCLCGRTSDRPIRLRWGSSSPQINACRRQSQQILLPNRVSTAWAKHESHSSWNATRSQSG